MVAPEKLLSVLSVSVPAPVLVRFPVPVRSPEKVALVVADVSTVPPPAPRFTARPVTNAPLVVSASVPEVVASPSVRSAEHAAERAVGGDAHRAAARHDGAAGVRIRRVAENQRAAAGHVQRAAEIDVRDVAGPVGRLPGRDAERRAAVEEGLTGEDAGSGDRERPAVVDGERSAAAEIRVRRDAHRARVDRRPARVGVVARRGTACRVPLLVTVPDAGAARADAVRDVVGDRDVRRRRSP